MNPPRAVFTNTLAGATFSSCAAAEVAKKQQSVIKRHRVLTTKTKRHFSNFTTDLLAGVGAELRDRTEIANSRSLRECLPAHITLESAVCKNFVTALKRRGLQL